MTEAELSAKLQEKLESLVKFEARIRYMYVDSAEDGNVTIGIGHNLTDSGAAARTTFFGTRKFMVARTERALDRLNAAAQARVKLIPVPVAARKGLQATPAEVQADFDYLTLLPGLKTVSPVKEPYKTMIQTTVELDDSEISSVFVDDLKKFRTDARSVFADFDSLPIPCQAGIVNLMFNMGRQGFIDRQKGALVDAIKAKGVYKGMPAAERWVSVAKMSALGDNVERDNAVSGWFMEGSKETTVPNSP